MHRGQGAAHANLEPLVRAMQLSRAKQLKKLQQLQVAAQMEAERREAAAAREERAQRRLVELEAQRRQQTTLKAQHARVVEVGLPQACCQLAACTQAMKRGGAACGCSKAQASRHTASEACLGHLGSAH